MEDVAKATTHRQVEFFDLVSHHLPPEPPPTGPKESCSDRSPHGRASHLVRPGDGLVQMGGAADDYTGEASTADAGAVRSLGRDSGCLTSLATSDIHFRKLSDEAQLAARLGQTLQIAISPGDNSRCTLISP